VAEILFFQLSAIIESNVPIRQPVHRMVGGGDGVVVIGCTASYREMWISRIVDAASFPACGE